MQNYVRYRSYATTIVAMPPAVKRKKTRSFDPDIFLATIGEGRKSLSIPKKQGIYAQGDSADSIFYVQQGKIRLVVVSKTAKKPQLGF
jgi:CRP/FNR family cyclic AMP-dependent transcriptional regulator